MALTVQGPRGAASEMVRVKESEVGLRTLTLPALAEQAPKVTVVTPAAKLVLAPVMATFETV